MKGTWDNPALASPKSPGELLDMYFLDMRSHLLETAAALDRIERAALKSGSAYADPRLQKLSEALDLLIQGKKNRVEQFLRLFSDPER